MAFDRQVGIARRIIDGEAGGLNVLDAGSGEAVVVFVHGYPDTSAVWLATIAHLVDDVRCVAYDVRGAGGSSAPATVEGYRIGHLVTDLVTVLDAVAPRTPVHLVGHDWGSVQCWEAVLRVGSDPRLAGRLASYTSISGPSLGYVGAWVRRSVAAGWSRRRQVVRQGLRSWYVGAVQVPVLPDLALRAMLSRPRAARRLLGSRPVGPTVARDAVNGLGLYRANVGRLSRGAATGGLASLRTDLPVQLIVPLRDPFLTPDLYDDLPRYCSNLTRHDLDTGHWAQVSASDTVADLVRAFVTFH